MLNIIDWKWLWKVLQPPSHQIFKWSFIFHQIPFLDSFVTTLLMKQHRLRGQKSHAGLMGPIPSLYTWLSCAFATGGYKQNKKNHFYSRFQISSFWRTLSIPSIWYLYTKSFRFHFGPPIKVSNSAPLRWMFPHLIFDICTAMMAAALALFFRSSQSTKNQHWKGVVFFCIWIFV